MFSNDYNASFVAKANKRRCIIEQFEGPRDQPGMLPMVNKIFLSNNVFH